MASELEEPTKASDHRGITNITAREIAASGVTFQQAIEYARYSLGRKKSDISSSKLGEALLKIFQDGYNGNHQPFAAKKLTLHRARTAKLDDASHPLSTPLYTPTTTHPTTPRH